jgi:hypothetical protein
LVELEPARHTAIRDLERTIMISVEMGLGSVAIADAMMDLGLDHTILVAHLLPHMANGIPAAHANLNNADTTE